MQNVAGGLEPISIRRAQLADADKVRYRVYKTPTDFVAVIAESALMAMKATGVKNPHKIVRDLPTDGVAIEARRMAQIEENAERILVSPIQQEPVKKRLFAEIAPRGGPQEHQADFRPITLGDLQRAGANRARILSPQMLSEIIDEYSKVGAPPVPEPAMVEPVVAPPAVAPAPAAQAAPVAAPIAPPADAPPSEPELSQEEKVMQLANALLPSAKDVTPAAEASLSADEVNKLLNE